MLVHLITALMSATTSSAALQVREEVVEEVPQLALEDDAQSGDVSDDDDAPVSQLESIEWCLTVACPVARR